MMECPICKHGETEPGCVTVPLQRGTAIVIVKNVPADVCVNCGEYYLSEEVAREVLSLAEDAVSKRVEIEVLSFAA